MQRLTHTLYLSILMPAAAAAQGYGAIDELIVTAAPTGDRVFPPSVELDHEAIQEFQPVAAADVFRNLTGIALRTNSRGESVIRIRGAEERQTLVFLDGAPLTTPWDGRADLALLPAGLIDRIEVTRGAVPIEYGANAVAGAVDLFTYMPEPGHELRAELQRGSLGIGNLNAVAGLGLDNGWSFVGGASRIDRDAERIADRKSVAFDPSTTRARTNTDMSGKSGYVAAGYAGASYNVRLSLLHADVERGVAAQGDLDPAVSRVRFWRTPDWRLSQATLNGSWDMAAGLSLRVTGWRQWFEQSIDAYTDYSYSTLGEREQGEDDTLGARLVFALRRDPATLRLVSTAQESTHDNVELATDTGDVAGLVPGPRLRYRQRLVTLGAEADVRIGDTLTSTFGIATDRARTPLTGDKTAQPALSASSWSAGLRWDPAEDWSVSATLGERSRFPSLRELYGAALGRFLPNADLRPERSLLADVNVRHAAGDDLFLDIALWANDSDGTLSQRVVEAGGANLRQRYNRAGSFTWGFEAAATLYLTRAFRVEFSAALQDGRAEREASGERPALLQRPDARLRAALDWQATSRLDLRVEAQHTSSARDLDDDGALARLPDATSFNLRGFLQLADWLGRDIQLTASVDNLSDELILPQLGLPAPGRTWRIGIRVN